MCRGRTGTTKEVLVYYYGESLARAAAAAAGRFDVGAKNEKRVKRNTAAAVLWARDHHRRRPSRPWETEPELRAHVHVADEQIIVAFTASRHYTRLRSAPVIGKLRPCEKTISLIYTYYTNHQVSYRCMWKQNKNKITFEIIIQV